MTQHHKEPKQNKKNRKERQKPPQKQNKTKKPIPDRQPYGTVLLSAAAAAFSILPQIPRPRINDFSLQVRGSLESMTMGPASRGAEAAASLCIAAGLSQRISTSKLRQKQVSCRTEAGITAVDSDREGALLHVISSEQNTLK